jgi:hypothetical protein
MNAADCRCEGGGGCDELMRVIENQTRSKSRIQLKCEVNAGALRIRARDFIYMILVLLVRLPLGLGYPDCKLAKRRSDYLSTENRAMCV